MERKEVVATLRIRRGIACRIVMGLFALSLFSNSLQAQSNDNCSGAITLVAGDPCTSGTNAGATTAGDGAGVSGATCWTAGDYNNSVFYKFVATNDSMTVSFGNGTLGTDLEGAVYSGSCGSLVQLPPTSCTAAGNDLNLTGLTVGNTYYIMVDGYSTITGSFCISVSSTLPGNNNLIPLINTSGCGLNYVQASNRITSRHTGQTGTGLPSTFAISGLPATCKTIDKAYLFYEVSYNTLSPIVSPTVTIKNPANVTTTYSATLVGRSQQKAWGEMGTASYRTDVTASITSNGNYVMNTEYPANDIDGGTLLIIYRDMNATYQGHLMIDNGIITINSFSAATHTITGVNACAAATGNTFLISGDFQFATHSNTVTGASVTAPVDNFWNFDVLSTNFTAAQSTIAFSQVSNYVAVADCFSLIAVGAYYQTTTCATCNVTLTVAATATATTCGSNNGSATATASTGIYGPYTYSWSPGGQTTQTATGLAPGTYTVTISDASGCKTATNTVTIGGSSTISVTASASSPTLCAGQSTTLTGSGATNYTWSANAASATSSTTTVSPSTGVTVYTVTGVTGSCSNTATVSVNVTSLPNITASAGSTTLCPGQNTTLTANGGASYVWSANTGNATTSTVSVTPPVGTAVYSVTGTSGGCSNTASVSVTVNTPPNVSASASPASLCSGQSAVLTAGGASSYVWSANAGSATTSTVSVAPPSGSVTYTVTGTSGGCSGTHTVSVTANPLPNAAASTTGTISCGGGTATVDGSSTTAGVTYSWSGPGVVSGGNTSSATVNLQGVYTVTVSDPGTGCVNTATTSVSTSTAVPNAAASTTGTLTCSNNSAVISGSSSTGGVTMQWNGPSGFSSTAASATVNVAGTYTFTVTDPGSGCTNVALTSVTTNTNNPVASASTTGTLSCSTGTVAINGNSSVSGAVFSWSGPGAYTSSSQNNNVSAGGVYTLTVTDPSNGCASTATTSVTQSAALPNVSASVSGSMGCSGGTATVTASSTTSGVSYAWSGTGIVSGANTSVATVNAAGTYTVTVTDPSNGCTNTGTATVGTSTAVPSANATVSNTITCAQNNATLNGSSTTSGVTFSWSGPSSFTSSVANPVVNVMGTYTLTVTDPANGCTNSVTVNVSSDTNQPGANASTTGTISCSGGTATVTASSSASGANYSWGGPGIVSGGNANSAIVSMQGTYTVTVTDPSNGCVSTATTNVTISAGVPNASANTTGSITCVNNSVTINGNSTTSGATYSWNGPGGFTSTSASATVNAIGDYTLTVTDPGNGCTNSVVTAVTTNTTAPGVNTSSAGSITCVTTTASVNASSTTSGVTYSWSGAGIVSGASSSAAVVGSAGTYTVSVTDPSNGCTSFSVATVSTNTTQPGANASTTGTISCGGGSATVNASSNVGSASYSWSGPGIVSGGNTSSATVNAAGVYTVQVTDPSNGCVNTATTTVTLDAAVPNASASTSGTITCSNNTAPLNGNSTTTGATFSWSGPSGFSATGQNVTANNSGTYTVTVMDPSNGCTNTATVSVASNTVAPNASASASGLITCSTLTANVSAGSSTAGTTYAWSGPSGFTASGANASVGAAGVYTVTVTDPSNGCSGTDTANVPSNTTAPAVNAGIDVNIPFGGSTALNASGGTNYVWSPASALSCTTCANPTANPSVTTIYCVQAQGANGCIGNDCVEVTVEAECGEIFVPTAFSPNGDGHNELECVMGNCVTSMEFTIYDRWGEKVFESTSSKHCWDGTFRGEKLNTAVFAYYLRAVLTNGKEVIKKGNINLIR